jgi:hypothetical protein
MNEQFMLLIIIKVDVVVYQVILLNDVHWHVLSLNRGGIELCYENKVWIWLLLQMAFHNLLMVTINLIVWKIRLPKRYATILHTFGFVIIVYKLGTQVWSCMIV